MASRADVVAGTFFSLGEGLLVLRHLTVAEQLLNCHIVVHGELLGRRNGAVAALALFLLQLRLDYLKTAEVTVL